MFQKILIANRGEIACRIIRTARQMGIYCIAIYSTEDAQALHVKLADEAHWVGPSDATLSYLNQAAIFKIAQASGVEAIHPGYGFLSENADFAEACEKHAITFIGAPAAAIRSMGSKIGAKQLMAKAGVPLLPGYHSGEQNPKHLLKQAQKIGFPILIKASAGGGGKGMRIVKQAEDFLEHLAGCKREAKKAFGNDDVLLEKYLTAPRHIEIQIFADQHGHCLHLFERDCSIQRRHQKVLEEAPAPHMTEAIRQQMGQAAILAATSVHYVGAGTIEFLYDQGQFYFMEMNTRLQVEHPVTEMISGIDLVAWQLMIAAGLPLPCNQDKLKIHGHAIEARIYAEDPYHDFLPTIGTIEAMHVPECNTQVRLDTGIQVGDKISIYYDPMLAKLICFGPTRDIAIKNLQQALSHYALVGLKTNVAFLSHLISLNTYQQGYLTTGFIEQHPSLLQVNTHFPLEILALASAYQLTQLTAASHSDPWDSVAGWQNASNRRYQWQWAWHAQVFDLSLEQIGRHWLLSLDQKPLYYLHTWETTDQRWQWRMTDLTTNTECSQSAILHAQADHLNIFYQQQSYQLDRLPRFALQQKNVHADNHLAAPMPGRILSLLCESEQTVAQGQALLIMEAMKMEHTIRAPKAGILRQYLCSIGTIVNEGDLLVDFD